MQTILVLTDFSDNAFLAAEYASLLCRQFSSSRLLLFHAYQQTGAVEAVPVVAMGTTDLHQENLHMMEVWQESVRELVSSVTEVSFLIDETSLEEGVNRICKEEGVDLVVMGITGRTGLEKIMIGSNAIRVMSNCAYPLLIVPENASPELPKTVLLATDLRDVQEKLETTELVKFLQVLPGRLMVVNVAKKEAEAADLRTEIGHLYNALQPYNPQVYYTTNTDIVEGINSVATEQNAGLVITLHKKSSGLSALFRSSVSQKMAWHIKVPLLVLPVG